MEGEMVYCFENAATGLLSGVLGEFPALKEVHVGHYEMILFPKAAL